MAKVSPLINNFSAGEFGPLTSARVDLDRYGQSAEEMTNFIPTVQGAAQKRTGSKYVGTHYEATGDLRLVPFVFSNQDNYILAVNGTGFTVYKDGAEVLDINNNHVAVGFPFTITDIMAATFKQSNDVMYVCGGALPIKIIRYSDTKWSADYMEFEDGPFIENTSFYNETKQFRSYTPSAATGTITLSPNGLGSLTRNADTSDGYLSFTAIANEELRVGEEITITGLLGLGLAGITMKITYVDFLGTTFYTDKLASTFPLTIPYMGHFRRIFGPITYIYDETAAKWGRVRVDSVNVSGVITATVLDTLSNTNTKYLWKDNAYRQIGAFPSDCAFFQDRLWFVGPNQFVAGSKVGDYENFTPHDLNGVVAANDAITFNLLTESSSQCKWIVADEKGILIGTDSSEFLVKSASTQTPITPTSIDATRTTAFGSASIQPVKAGKAVVFAQASGRKLREFNYFFDVDGFRCQDLNQLAHHITKTGIKQIAIQKQPEQIVWAVRNDGVLLGMTYERDIDGLRVAWHKHILGGAKNSNGDEVEVLSIACIPTDDNSYDEVWMVVKRLINGSIAYSIEYMDQPFSDEVEQEDSRFLDCSLTYNQPKTITAITKANPAKVTSASHGFNDGDKVRFDNIEGMTELNGNIYIVSNKTTNDFELKDFDGNNINSTSYSTYFANGEVRKLVTTISGLTHLNGQQVVAFGDGANIGTFTVSAGSITLDEPAAVVTVGLKYKARIKLPRLEAGSTDGTALGKTRRIHRLGAAVYRTLGLKYGQDFDNMQSFEFQDGDDQLNQAPPLYTGIITTEVEFDYDFNNNICLESDEPNNCTILAVMPQMHTQDR